MELELPLHLQVLTLSRCSKTYPNNVEAIAHIEYFIFLNRSHPGSRYYRNIKAASLCALAHNCQHRIKVQISGTHWFLLPASEDSSIPSWGKEEGLPQPP